MHTFTTDLSAEQGKGIINEIVGALGLSTAPLNDHSYQQREDMTVLAEISPDRHYSGAMRAWIVGYQDVTRMSARVLVFPHEWASFDIGTQAIYDEFIRLVGERMTPVQTDQPEQATPPQPETPLVATETTQSTRPRRGRKDTPVEQQREIAEFYLAYQDTMSYEKVGGRFGVSGRTVQRYVDKFKMS